MVEGGGSSKGRGGGRRKRQRESGADERALKVPPSSADVKEDGLDNAEEARLRELVFGKGDETFLGSFGSEAQQHTHRRRQQDLETWFDSSTALIGGQERGEAKGEQQKLQPFWVEGVTGEGGILDGTGATSPGSRDDAVPGRVLSKGSAWVDEDDARLKVDISAKNRLKKLRQDKSEGEMSGPVFEQRLRSRFTISNVTTDWAKAAEDDALGVSSGNKGPRRRGDDLSDDEEDTGNALLRNSSALKGGNGSVLEPGHLDIVRCKDANQHEPAKATVRAVSFHPEGELLLTGGFDKTLRLFQVDGVRNNKVHSIFFSDLPITNAMFTAPEQAVITGRRPFFYSYDVPTGKIQKIPRIFSSGRAEKHLETFAASPDGRWLAFAGDGGYVLLVSSKSKQWAAEFKLNSPATAVAFTKDSQFVLAAGGDGDVYKFDVRSRRCLLRFFNEGGTSTTSIDVSPSTSSARRFMAVGSDSGVVNMYDEDALDSSIGKRVLRPSPLKALMSLTTPVTTTKFSPDGQMLAIASNQKRDALKVIHAASCSSFTNWPTERTPVRYPFALDFSPGGGYLAVGNDRGCVLLYRVRHYPQA